MKLFAGLCIAVIAVVGVYVFMNTKNDVAGPVVSQTAINYLPLGDSYTIGEGVSEERRWPNQLRDSLRAEGIELEIVATPARTGDTTQDVLDRQLKVMQASKPSFVTLQIGVNDWLQNQDVKGFEQRLSRVLDEVQAVLPDKRNVMLVTIPDFGKTPAGPSIALPQEITLGLRDFNEVIRQQGKQRDLPVADVFVISQQAQNDPALVAADGLHPSGKQYEQWLETIRPAALQILRR